MAAWQPTIDLEPAFLAVAEKEVARMSQWFYRTPMLVSAERYAELARLQDLLYRAIRFFVVHYADYSSLLTLNPKAQEIVARASAHPYRVGTYRPDFVISTENEIKICEINARFPLNGYFNAAVTECIVHQLADELGIPKPPYVNRKFLAYLNTYFGELTDVCILKSPGDRPMDLRLYSKIFELSGIPFAVIEPDQLAGQMARLSTAAVINELNQMDLEMLDPTLIEKTAAANSLNDLRTIFLVHDKRFLSVLWNTSFLADFLTDQEISFLTRHIIPTYTRVQAPELWQQARAQKEGWIIKPFLLGKSENTLAGCVTENARWQAAFDGADIEQMILQPFIPQKRFVASLGGRMYQDYVVGTFLGFDGEFFGPGRFRTSSFPVTNQGDDRKVAPLLVEDAGVFQSPFVL